MSLRTDAVCRLVFCVGLMLDGVDSRPLYLKNDRAC